MTQLKARTISSIKTLLYTLAAIAALLLVLKFIAPSLTEAVIKPFSYLLQNLGDLDYTVITYLIMQLFIVGFLLLVAKLFHAKLADFGVGKMKKWYLILLVPVFWMVYMVITIGVTQLLALLVPEFNLHERQELGLSAEASQNLLLMGVFLCVIVPLAEEFAFRGYLFGLLRKKNSFWTTTILTSLVFAFMHLLFDSTSGSLEVKQMNVAVDVFILSLFLGLLREKTNSIWAGVALHSAKNFVAFLVLFVYNLSR